MMWRAPPQRPWLLSRQAVRGGSLSVSTNASSPLCAFPVAAAERAVIVRSPPSLHHCSLCRADQRRVRSAAAATECSPPRPRLALRPPLLVGVDDNDDDDGGGGGVRADYGNCEAGLCRMFDGEAAAATSSSPLCFLRIFVCVPGSPPDDGEEPLLSEAAPPQCSNADECRLFVRHALPETRSLQRQQSLCHSSHSHRHDCRD